LAQNTSIVFVIPYRTNSTQAVKKSTFQLQPGETMDLSSSKCLYYCNICVALYFTCHVLCI